MADSWGGSWATSWADSWSPDAVPQEDVVGGGGFGAYRRRTLDATALIGVKRARRRKIERVRKQIVAKERVVAKAEAAPKGAKRPAATKSEKPAVLSSAPPPRPELTQPPAIVTAPPAVSDMAAYMPSLDELYAQFAALQSAQRRDEDDLIMILLLAA